MHASHQWLDRTQQGARSRHSTHPGLQGLSHIFLLLGIRIFISCLSPPSGALHFNGFASPHAFADSSFMRHALPKSPKVKPFCLGLQPLSLFQTFGRKNTFARVCAEWVVRGSPIGPSQASSPAPPPPEEREFCFLLQQLCLAQRNAETSQEVRPSQQGSPRQLHEALPTSTCCRKGP